MAFLYSIILYNTRPQRYEGIKKDVHMFSTDSNFSKQPFLLGKLYDRLKVTTLTKLWVRVEVRGGVKVYYY